MSIWFSYSQIPRKNLLREDKNINGVVYCVDLSKLFKFSGHRYHHICLAVRKGKGIIIIGVLK